LFSEAPEAFSLKTPGDQGQPDAVNPLDGLSFWLRQPCFRGLARRIGEKFFARSFINIDFREKGLKA
jgi:hypothetical protein